MKTFFRLSTPSTRPEPSWIILDKDGIDFVIDVNKATKFETFALVESAIKEILSKRLTTGELEVHKFYVAE